MGGRALSTFSQMEKCGSLDSILSGGSLQHHGVLFGYRNPSKTWLLTKAEHLDKAEFSLPKHTSKHHHQQGRPYLGAPLGNPDYVQSFVSNKVNSWMEEINVLSDVALSQPHAALAAFTHGMIHKFTYLCRTTPDIDQLLSPLEISSGLGFFQQSVVNLLPMI